MKTYSVGEQERILDLVEFPKGLSMKEGFVVLLWTLFHRRAYWKFLERLENGEHTYYAYKNACQNE